MQGTAAAVALHQWCRSRSRGRGRLLHAASPANCTHTRHTRASNCGLPVNIMVLLAEGGSTTLVERHDSQRKPWLAVMRGFVRVSTTRARSCRPKASRALLYALCHQQRSSSIPGTLKGDDLRQQQYQVSECAVHTGTNYAPISTVAYECVLELLNSIASHCAPPATSEMDQRRRRCPPKRSLRSTTELAVAVELGADNNDTDYCYLDDKTVQRRPKWAMGDFSLLSRTVIVATC